MPSPPAFLREALNIRLVLHLFLLSPLTMTIKADPLTPTLFEPEERTLEKMIRPYRLNEYVGQTQVCEQLRIFIGAAQARQEALDHILFFGPPGLGKCITADSLILTGNGWEELSSILPPSENWAADQYRVCPHKLYGLQGLEKASHLYNGGIRPTLKLWTACGFSIEGTFNHRLLAPLRTESCPPSRDLHLTDSAYCEWRALPEFSVQDSVLLVKNMQVWRPHTLELSAVVQIQAHHKYQQFSALANSIAHLRSFTLSSPHLPIAIMDYTLQLSYLLGALIGHGRHPQARLPNWILRSSGKVIVTCLAGLLTHCPRQNENNTVTYELGADFLSQQVQLLLLNLGVMSRRYLYRQHWQLQFHSSEWEKCQIQFNLILTHSPLNSPAPELFNDRITAVIWSRSQVYDFCVPSSHTFLANGFFNHNTTLAQVTAHEMGVNLRSTSGPVLEKAGDLAALLTHLEPKDILFIDEIHRLSPGVAEILYPAMEDYQLDIMVGEGPAARSLKLSLPPFTLIGATTRAGLLTSPLRDRFGITQRLEFYTEEQLARIVQRTATLLTVPIDPAGALEIARRSRGTPRIANRLLKRVRDYAQMWGADSIDQTVAQRALDLLSIDPRGLDPLDHRFLTTLLQAFNGGPVGIDSLAAAIGEERGTLEDVVEPFLLQQGFLIRTARGRMATPLTWQHCQLSPQRQEYSQEDLLRPNRS